MEFISEGIFEKYSTMKILVFEIFEKGQIWDLFQALHPKNWNFVQKNLMVAYVFYLLIFRRIEEGVGIHPPPPRPLRYQKKRDPERVNREGENF